MWWFELFEQYKFTIHYISKNNNDKTNALSRRNDYIKEKEIFNHSVLKINQNKSLSINVQELNITLRILKYNKEQFSFEKNKLQISQEKITITLRNITTIYWRDILILQKLFNSYDKIFSFYIWDNKSRRTLKDVLTVNKISMTRMLNMRRFSINNHVNCLEKK